MHEIAPFFLKKISWGGGGGVQFMPHQPRIGGYVSVLYRLWSLIALTNIQACVVSTVYYVHMRTYSEAPFFI